jgi:hypothetical protein
LIKLRQNEDELKKLRDSDFQLQKNLKDINASCTQRKMEFSRLESTCKDLKDRLT